MTYCRFFLFFPSKLLLSRKTLEGCLPGSYTMYGLTTQSCPAIQTNQCVYRTAISTKIKQFYGISSTKISGRCQENFARWYRKCGDNAEILRHFRKIPQQNLKIPPGISGNLRYFRMRLPRIWGSFSAQSLCAVQESADFPAQKIPTGGNTRIADSGEIHL